MLRRIAAIFEEIAPKVLEASWDNTGILVEPYELSTTNRVMLTIDLTSAVLEEAISKKVSVIVAYHPVIFKGIKSIQLNDKKQQIISKCLHHHIGVFSPHTRLDAITGGINDWIVEPFIGEIIIPDDKMGRMILLKDPIPFNTVISTCKQHFNVKHLLYANPRDNINSIAVCAGSGASVLLNFDADCYITGELGHHDVLHFIEQGKSVVVTNHTNTERGYLVKLKLVLETKGITTMISTIDKDPLQFC